MLSKNAAYFTLLGLVYDQLPKNFETEFIKQDTTGVPAKRVVSVGSGTTKDLPLLIKVVEVILPDFTIPENIKTAV